MPTYSGAATWRAIVIATTIAGTLDILAAFLLSIMVGGTPLGVLGGVGGAIVDRTSFANPLIPAAIGLALHFAIMAVMAAVYVGTASHVPFLNRIPLLSGVGYGIVTWLVMYWLVLPQRWPTLFPVADLREIAEQLFCHIMLVGIPIALVTRRAARWRFDEIW